MQSRDDFNVKADQRDDKINEFIDDNCFNYIHDTNDYLHAVNEKNTILR